LKTPTGDTEYLISYNSAIDYVFPTCFSKVL